MASTLFQNRKLVHIIFRPLLPLVIFDRISLRKKKKNRLREYFSRHRASQRLNREAKLLVL